MYKQTPKSKAKTFDTKTKKMPAHKKPSPNPKSAWMYTFLAVFFGYAGVHNFYAGYKVKGVAQLLLFLLLGWLIYPIIVLICWTCSDIHCVKEDASGTPFERGCEKMQHMMFLLMLVLLCLFSGVAFLEYSHALTNYKKDAEIHQVFDYTARLAIASQVIPKTNIVRDCDDVLDYDNFEYIDSLNCTVTTSDDRLHTIIIIRNLPKSVREKLKTYLQTRSGITQAMSMRLIEKKNSLTIIYGVLE